MKEYGGQPKRRKCASDEKRMSTVSMKEGGNGNESTRKKEERMN